jgi:hypothetical protein
MGQLRTWMGRAGAATQRTLGDSSGQQGITNLEVSGHFTALGLGRESAGLGFHTAEATGRGTLLTSLWPPLAGTDIGSALTGYHLQAYVQRFSSLLP